MPFHDGHFGHFEHFGYYGLTQYGPEYGHHWCLWKDQEKCRSPMKTELKKLQRFKSYGQIKIGAEIRAIFLSILAQIFTELEGPLRMLGIGWHFFGAYWILNEWDKCVAENFWVLFDMLNHPIVSRLCDTLIYNVSRLRDTTGCFKKKWCSVYFASISATKHLIFK